VEPVRERESHELVPGGMELDLSVVAQPRRELVREPPPLERLAGEKAPEGRAPLRRPAGALALEPLHERPVAAEEIVAGEPRRLVAARRDGVQAHARNVIRIHPSR
jgi:hypothetical protein